MVRPGIAIPGAVGLSPSDRAQLAASMTDPQLLAAAYNARLNETEPGEASPSQADVPNQEDAPNQANVSNQADEERRRNLVDDQLAPLVEENLMRFLTETLQPSLERKLLEFIDRKLDDYIEKQLKLSLESSLNRHLLERERQVLDVFQDGARNSPARPSNNPVPNDARSRADREPNRSADLPRRSVSKNIPSRAGEALNCPAGPPNNSVSNSSRSRVSRASHSHAGPSNNLGSDNARLRAGGALSSPAGPSNNPVPIPDARPSVGEKRALEAEEVKIHKRQRLGYESDDDEVVYIPTWKDIDIGYGSSAGSNRKPVQDLLKNSILPQAIKTLISREVHNNLEHRKESVQANNDTPTICWMSAQINEEGAAPRMNSRCEVCQSRLDQEEDVLCFYFTTRRMVRAFL